MNMKIVVLGDSITWGAYTDKNIWWQELGELLGCNPIVGNGVRGSCFSGTSDYKMEREPMSERWKSLPTGADLYIIFGGTNDYGHGSVLGSPDDTTDISFYGAMHLIITGLQKANPNAKIVFMTPLSRYGFGETEFGNQLLYDTTPNAQGHILEDYRQAILAKCKMLGVPVIDTYQISEFDFSAGQDGVHPFDKNAEGKSPLTVDGLHPNTEGHLKLAEKILPYVEALLNEVN